MSIHHSKSQKRKLSVPRCILTCGNVSSWRHWHGLAYPRRPAVYGRCFGLALADPDPLSSALAIILSISARISARFDFKVLTSSNLRRALASSTKDSNKASCSSSGCNAWATSESGSTSCVCSSAAEFEGDDDVVLFGFGNA